MMEADPDAGYVGCTAEMPLVMADGRSLLACARNVIEATATTIVILLERGEKPPAPASESRREQQVNIRLTADEKMRLEESARREGFRSLSDYIRTAALRRTA